MSELTSLSPQGRSPAGDVVGPSLSTDNALVRFDGTTGKLIQNSSVILDDSGNMSGVNTLVISGTTGNVLVVNTNAFVVDATNKRIGVGVTTPTASVHLKAGVAAAGGAPIKLTAGVNLTSPEAGAIEFDGTNLYYTNAALARQTINVSGGNVVGAASSTDNALARFDGVTGKIIQNSVALLDDTGNMSGLLSLAIAGGTGTVLAVNTNLLVVNATTGRVGVGVASPDTVLHIVGASGMKFRGLASGFTGSEDFKLQSSLQTTNNTPTNLTSVSLDEGQMVVLEAKIGGLQSDFTDATGGTVICAARRGTGGNITLVGLPVFNILESDTLTDITVAVDTGTQTLNIQVTGVTAQTWNWVATYTYHKVLSNT